MSTPSSREVVAAAAATDRPRPDARSREALIAGLAALEQSEGLIDTLLQEHDPYGLQILARDALFPQPLQARPGGRAADEGGRTILVHQNREAGLERLLPRAGGDLLGVIRIQHSGPAITATRLDVTA